MTQGLLQRGRASATDLSNIIKENSGNKLTQMTQALFQRGRPSGTDLRRMAVTDREGSQTKISQNNNSEPMLTETEMLRRSKIAESARQKRIADRAWLDEEMSDGLTLTKVSSEAATKLERMKRSITSTW